MTYEIIKGAPVPRKGNKKAVYPFSEMEIGDAFDAPRKGPSVQGSWDKTQNIISSCARGYAKRHNPTAKFTVRILDENTVRCWRIA